MNKPRWNAIGNRHAIKTFHESLQIEGFAEYFYDKNNESRQD